MPKIKVFPLLLFLLALSFTMRFGVLVQNFIEISATSKSAKAQSDISNADSLAMVRSSMPSDPIEDDEEELAQVETVTQIDPNLTDPFTPVFTEEEVRILQSLAKRRDEIIEKENRLNEREAILNVAERRIEAKAQELEELRMEIEKLLDMQEDIEEERIIQLVKIYESMKPKDAANIFNELQFDVLLAVVMRMNERRVSAIIAAMEPVKARYLSARMAEQSSLPRPTRVY